jgi:SAM-dependent methyltransferase
MCAPGILRLLQPVLERKGTVLELGCGSGLLTKYLVDAGHQVIATDASEPMLALARETAPGAEEIRVLVMPDDPMPACDAVVSIGHVLSYLDSEREIERSLAAAADALRPGGILAIDLSDVRWNQAWTGTRASVRRTEEWVIATEYSAPAPNKFVREMTTFVRNEDGTWRRDDERHENTLIDTVKVPALLAEHGVQAQVRASFGDEQLPDGLVAVVGQKLRSGGG